MLFNSIPFILFFLPLVLAVFFGLGRYTRQGAALWLALASLFFYGWWDSRYLALLLASIGGNFFLGLGISRQVAGANLRRASQLLALAVVINLLILGYYKYAGFFVGNLNALGGLEIQLRQVVLPLGISFFTFTQIAFLVDCRQGKVSECNFVHYLLFVTYFPHLIAGPILHHSDMMPQFAKPSIYRPHWADMAAGLLMFSIGLFKKVVLADGISPYVGPVFDAAAQGHAITWLDATSSALAYTLQLYFDFSGYSDMAVGISRLFGVHLPLNFNSPYQAASIIEFWRRWHMTLSRFLKDYLYIPLGGNRNGPARRHANLFLTMVLGGLWHGAAWTYVVWGAGHGVLLGINHAWRKMTEAMGFGLGRGGQALAVCLTFACVVCLWVVFRANDLSAAGNVLAGMAGLHGVVLPEAWQSGVVGKMLGALGATFTGQEAFLLRPPLQWFFWGLLLVWFAPNSQGIVAALTSRLDSAVPAQGYRAVIGHWRILAVVAGLVFFYALTRISKGSEFLYFQF